MIEFTANEFRRLFGAHRLGANAASTLYWHYHHGADDIKAAPATAITGDTFNTNDDHLRHGGDLPIHRHLGQDIIAVIEIYIDALERTLRTIHLN